MRKEELWALDFLEMLLTDEADALNFYRSHSGSFTFKPTEGLFIEMRTKCLITDVSTVRQSVFFLTQHSNAKHKIIQHYH